MIVSVGHRSESFDLSKCGISNFDVIVLKHVFGSGVLRCSRSTSALRPQVSPRRLPEIEPRWVRSAT